MTAPHAVRLLRRRTRLQILAVAVVAPILLVGCTAKTTSAASFGDAAPTAALSADSGRASSAAGSAAAPSEAAAGAASAAAPEADQAAPDLASQAAAPRSVVRTADVRIRLDVPEPAVTGTADEQDAARERDRRAALSAALASARATAGGVGGFVAAATDDEGRADLTLRVPTASFDQVRDSLAGLGTVTSSTETSTDVTAELVDGQSRVDTMTASVSRVRQLLTEAQAIGDVLAIESELTTREAELESWQRQVAALGDQVDLATVTLGITAVIVGGVAPVAVVEPSRNAFVTGLANGWDAFTGLLTGVAGVIGALLPFLPVLLVVGWVTWWVLRRRSGRSTRPTPRPVVPATD